MKIQIKKMVIIFAITIIVSYVNSNDVYASNISNDDVCSKENYVYLIQEQECDNKIYFYDEYIIKTTYTNDENGFYIDEIIEPTQENVMEIIEREKVEDTEYKYFRLYGYYDPNVGNNGEFYVSVEFEWLKEPSRRYVDLITIGFMDNIMLAESLIDNQFYPDLYSKFTYTQYNYATYIGSTSTYHVEEIDGSDYTDYSYNINEGLLGFEYDMPVDTYAGGRGYVYINTYTNFKMFVETRWTPTVSTISGTTISASYSHQIGSGRIDWGRINVSPLPPYISYSTSFWVNDPNFDDGIGGHIIFQEID